MEKILAVLKDLPSNHAPGHDGLMVLSLKNVGLLSKMILSGYAMTLLLAI
jgi:hypothetical protein